MIDTFYGNLLVLGNFRVRLRVSLLCCNAIRDRSLDKHFHFHIEKVGQFFRMLNRGMRSKLRKVGKANHLAVFATMSIIDAAVALEPNQLFNCVVEVGIFHVDNAVEIGQVRLFS